MKQLVFKGLSIFLVLVLAGQPALVAGGLEPVPGERGMVVAGHPEATGIGLAVLREGGTAMDAVVATALALGVAEPYGSGLGGKGAILYYEAASGEVYFIDGMDAAGRDFDPERLGRLSSGERAEGGAGIGVPGLLAALERGHREWGQADWEDLVRPAAELARSGSLVVPGMRIFFERRTDRIRSDPETSRIYLPDGQAPIEGTRLPNPDLARTLERIAEAGPEAFYGGEIAERIVAAVRAGGGHLTVEDFEAYEARMGEPLQVEFGETRLFAGGPPTTGGATALLAFKLLEGYDWDLEAGFNSAGNLSAWGAVLRHVYPRIQAAVADVAEAHAAWKGLMEPAVLTSLRAAALSDFTEAGGVPADRGKALDDGWTTHFVVADAAGNVASVTQSLSHHFGSGVTAPGTGVVLNNSLKNFSFSDPEGVNFGSPGKRPRSTIAPVIALRGEGPAFAFGLPGGGRIPTATLALLVDHLIFGSGLGEAIAAPRAHLRRDWSPEPVSDLFQVEGAFSRETAAALRDLGWRVERSGDTEFFGGVTALEFLPDGTLRGWADFRRTNHAAGF